MLPRRRIGAQALTWRTTGINSSYQIRLLATKRPSLPGSVENSTRINTILKVQKAVAATSSKLTLDSLTTDDQRRDYLWSRRAQLLKILPGREWKKVFSIARRLFEFNYLIRPPSDKDFKKLMLENSGELLIKLEQTPMWLSSEIKMLEGLEWEKQQETAGETGTKGPEEPNKPVNESPPTAPTPVEETSKEKEPTVSTSTQRLDRISVTPDDQLPSEGSEKEEIFRYDDLVISPGLESAEGKTASKPAQKTPAKSAEKPADRFLEKKATESAKDAPLQIINPDYDRIIRLGSKEEQVTVEKLNQLEMPEDKLSGAFEILQKLSRTLIKEKVRPDLKPVIYPNQASYALLAEATTLLEEACFQFIQKKAPSVTTWPIYDCPEAQEYKRWVDLIIKLGKEYSKEGFKLPPKFNEGMVYGDIIRNSAAHRLPIHAPKLRELLRRARVWVESLEVPETVEKFERLEQSAAEMQNEMEDALTPVVEEIRVVLGRIKGRWDEVKRNENKILEIQRAIRAEMVAIEMEELNMKDSLRKAQSVRYDLGQKFERDAFQERVHGSRVLVDESSVEKLPEEWEENEVPLEESLSETEAVSPAITKETKSSSSTIPKLKAEAAKIELSDKEVNDMLNGEEIKFSKADRTQLARDYQGGLVSYEKNTLSDIEDVSLGSETKGAGTDDPKAKNLKAKSTKAKDSGTKDLEANDNLEKKTISEDREVSDDKKVESSLLAEKTDPKKETSSKKRSKKQEKAKEVGFEGSNLSRDSDMESLKADTAKWYNPLSWFR